MNPIAVALITSVMLCACYDSSFDDPIACPDVVRPGIVVEIRDAVTQEPLADNAIVTITDDDYTEVLGAYAYEGTPTPRAVSVAGAYERPGVYDIDVIRDGYQGWTKSDVAVDSGECGVNTITFTVRLTTSTT